MLTHYNPSSMAYLAIKLIQSPKETILLSLEYKLQLFLPCIYPIFLNPLEKHELKADLLTTLNQLFQSFAARKNFALDNLNEFGFPLDKIVGKVLDYTSGTPDEKDKALGIEIFNNIKNILSEKGLASLLVLTIISSRVHDLFQYLLNEYKNGVTNALKNCNTTEEIQEKSSAFLNVNYLRRILEVGVNTSSSKFKDNTDLVVCCVNVVTLIVMKLSNFLKNSQDYSSLKFKDPNNLFSPVNLRILLEYGQKILGFTAKVKDEIQMITGQIDLMKKEDSQNKRIQEYEIKVNELYMISDSIERIGDILKDLKLDQKMLKLKK